MLFQHRDYVKDCYSETMKKRIDKLMVERGLAESREKAQAMIMAGNVLVDEQPAIKAGTASFGKRIDSTKRSRRIPTSAGAGSSFKGPFSISH